MIDGRIGRSDIILGNADIISHEGSITRGMDIHIAAGLITGVTKASGRPEHGDYVDCSGSVITPGLTVLHCHAPMTLMRGMVEDVTVDDWFNKWVWPYESRLTPDDIYHGAVLAIAELINNGVTAFADHYFFAHRIADAVMDTGIRAELAPTLFGLASGFDDELKSVVDLIQSRAGESPLLSFRMGPHAPYTCPPPLLKTIVDEAKALGLGIHIHVSETRAQVEASLREYGKTPFGMVKDAGGFDLPALIAHGVFVTPSDIQHLSESTWFAVSPKTYMKLASGVGDIINLQDNLNLATGTDGAVSSNTLNPLEQARIWSLLTKHTSADATRSGLLGIWKLLMNGHRALNRNTGVIETGYEADLVVWDLDKPNTAPVYDPISAIVYSGESANVRDVMVRGKFLKRGFELATIDSLEATRNASRVAARLIEQGAGKPIVTY